MPLGNFHCGETVFQRQGFDWQGVYDGLQDWLNGGELGGKLASGNIAKLINHLDTDNATPRTYSNRAAIWRLASS